MYKNGTLEGSESVSGTINAGNSVSRNFTIGDLMTWKSQYGFTGYVDEVAVWTAALTASEVENLYNDGEGRSAATYSNDLYAYYNFEDGSGSTVSDVSGNGINLTLTGGSFETDIPSNDNTPMTLTTDEDTAGTIDLSSFASDVDEDDLTYSITTDVTNGITGLSGSTVTYTPAANYNGTDSFMVSN